MTTGALQGEGTVAGGGPAAPIIWFNDVPADFHNIESQAKMAGLRVAGHRILYVDQIGVANPRVGNAGKALRYVVRRLRRPSPAGAASTGSELQLLLLPPRHHRVTDALNTRWIAVQLKRRAAALGFEQPILWYRYPSPELVRLIGRLEERLVVYECVDRYAAFGYSSRALAALERAERRLLDAADVTIVTSENLRLFAQPLTKRVVLHRVGVDVDRFVAAGPPPPELSRLPRPRIGYIGGLDDRVDVELLADVARDHPRGSIVLIGPVGSGGAAARLRALRNCHLLGLRPHGCIPGLLAGLDVALLPYRMTAVTRHVFPVKALEYLAAGLPCVATDLPELSDLADVIAIAPDRAAFRAAVTFAAEGRGLGTRESRQAAAARYRWSDRISGLLAIIEEAGRRRAGNQP